MRRFILLAVVGLVMWLGTVRAVRGQTAVPGTSVPAASATAVSKPSGSHLLDLMMRAWQASGSDHFILLQAIENAAGKVKVSHQAAQVGDVAWTNPPVFRMKGPTWEIKKTSSGKTKKRVQETQLYNENLLAIHIGKRKWTCNHFLGYSALPGTPVWDETSPFGLDAKTAGLVKVNGMPAWLVEEGFAQPGPKGSTHPKSIDIHNYFVSASTYLPLEALILMKTWDKQGSHTSGFALFFSQFGEQVRVQLPSVCNKKLSPTPVPSTPQPQ